MDGGVCWFYFFKFVIVGIDLFCVINVELWGIGFFGWWFIVVVIFVGLFNFCGWVIIGVLEGKWMLFIGCGIVLGCINIFFMVVGD